jgi:hypothetical protein
MPINANIMNALVRPVRSVQDYQDDYDRQDIRAQGMQRNALMMQEAQAMQQDRERTRMDGDTLRNALSMLPPGATYEQRISAMEGTNLPAGYTQADALRQALMRQRQGAATAGKDEAATATSEQNRKIEADKQVRARLQGAQNPKEAADIARAAVAGGYWDQSQAMAALDGMPIDLRQFDGWRQRQLAGAMAPKDLLPTLGSTNLGGAEQYTARNPLTGAVSVSGTAKRSMTPGEVSRLGEDQRQFGVTSGLAADKFKYEKENDVAERAGGGKATEGERNAAGYASRMVEATKLLDQFEKTGRSTYGTDIAGGLPLVGNSARTAVMNSDQQQYRQAQEDWVRAKLRKESGAAIATDEMDREIASYFPQPGEMKPVIDQKRRARAVAVEAMSKASGRAGYESTVPPTAEPLSAAEQAELEQLRAKLGRK